MSVTAIRPAPLARETFEVFSIGTGSFAGQLNPVFPYGDGDTFPTLEAAVERIAGLVHKQHYVVRQTDTFTGATLLKFYVIRKARPVARYHNFQTKLVADSYAEHLFDLREGAI